MGISPRDAALCTDCAFIDTAIVTSRRHDGVQLGVTMAFVQPLAAQQLYHTPGKTPAAQPINYFDPLLLENSELVLKSEVYCTLDS